MKKNQQMKKLDISKECGQWVADFSGKHGRPPRLLHIGNIANNAYLNAKILNRAGLECDVVSCNYYHIMGCPEWEEADFASGLLDQDRPDWKLVKLNGFKRPYWFVQGPRSVCQRYLMAMRNGHRFRSKFWWNISRLTWRSTEDMEILRRNRNGLASISSFLRKPIDIGGFNLEVFSLLLIATGLAATKFPKAVGAGLAALGVVMFISQKFKILSALRSMAAKIYKKLPLRVRNKVAEARQGKTSQSDFSASEAEYNSCMAEFTARFCENFPDREDKLTTMDLEPYRYIIQSWGQLFGQYDAVIGYSTDPILPLITNKRPYFAYEHGTIRSIPFEADTQGRLCAFSYRQADMSFITNCDNIKAVEKLGISKYRFVPHPVNEDLKPDGKALKLRKKLRDRLDADFIVFHPARQHWEEQRHPSWEKGNDIFIKGLARFVKEVNPKAAGVFVEWGHTVQESKALLASLGIADRVLWIPPQPNLRMVRYIMACDLLADQFFLGAFGSTMPKALLHGRPAMLYLDEDRHHWCFPKMPPVINAQTPLEVYEGLRKVYLDDDFREELTNQGRDWYDHYHSNRVIAETFISAFRSVLD